MKYWNIIDKQTELTLMFSDSLEIESLNWDLFIKKVKEEVSEILIKLIVDTTKLETSIEDDLEEIVRKFKIICYEILIPNGLEKLNSSISKRIWESAFEENILNKKIWWYNIIFIRILIKSLKEIETISKPINNWNILTKEEQIIISNMLMQKLYELRNLNFLGYILEWYISKFEELIKSKNQVNIIIKNLISNN